MTETLQVKTSKNKPARDARGRLLPGNTANPNGRPEKTEQDIVIEKAVKDYLKEHEEQLAQALPSIRPALIKKGTEGDVSAIKEIHAVLGAHKKEPEAPTTINLIQITQRINQVLDGGSTEQS